MQIRILVATYGRDNGQNCYGDYDQLALSLTRAVEDEPISWLWMLRSSKTGAIHAIPDDPALLQVLKEYFCQTAKNAPGDYFKF